MKNEINESTYETLKEQSRDTFRDKLADQVFGGSNSIECECSNKDIKPTFKFCPYCGQQFPKKVKRYT